jgi:hypothetical protein
MQKFKTKMQKFIQIIFFTILITNVSCGSFLQETTTEEIVVTPYTHIQGAIRMFDCKIGNNENYCFKISNFTISRNNRFERCYENLEIIIEHDFKNEEFIKFINEDEKYNLNNYKSKINEKTKERIKKHFITPIGTLDSDRVLANECSDIKRFQNKFLTLKNFFCKIF